MKLTDIWESNFVFNCETCDGTGELRMSRHDTDPDWCGECDGAGVVAFYAGTLFTNLAIAGGLCAAFNAGGVAPRLIPFGPGYIDEVTWRPGCGRPVPGWEVSRCGR